MPGDRSRPNPSPCPSGGRPGQQGAGIALRFYKTPVDQRQVSPGFSPYNPEIEHLLLDFFPAATDAIVYNHDVFDKHYEGDRTEHQAAKNPGVNAAYANLVHDDLNDNSGRVRCRELLTQNLRNFGRTLDYSEAEADAKMSRRFMSIHLAKPMEAVRQNPFVLCAWPSFADQTYINNYRATTIASARRRASRIAPTARADAPCRRDPVVRSYVLY